jgi:glutathione synthase
LILSTPNKENGMSRPISVFIIDPPERLDPPTDTSLALMRESLRRDHQVMYCTLSELHLASGGLHAGVYPVSFFPGEELFRGGELRDIDLSTVDFLYMRKDPPVDTAYLHATYLLDHLPETVLQINPARTLRNYCEKLIPLLFPGLVPESIVTRSADVLATFLDRHGEIVIKPLDDCSGRGIIRLSGSDPQRPAILDRATSGDTRFVQGQRFLPEIVEGDKRVLLLAGEILGCVRRVPAPGDFRSNVNAGGRCVPCDLTETDRRICKRLSPWLKREEIVLAGVDIVGNHVLEINITSPSCLREMNDLTGKSLETEILDYITRRHRRPMAF